MPNDLPEPAALPAELATDQILRWLIEDAPYLPDAGRIVLELSEKLRGAGVPLDRMTTHVRTLHPEVLGFMREWRHGRGVQEFNPPIGIETTPTFLDSPVYVIRRTLAELDCRLDREATVPGVLAELKAEGFTHYFIVPLIFTDGVVNAASWATCAPGGFSSADLALFRRLVPALRFNLELKFLRRVASGLLNTYVGMDAGGRILAGAIQRGHTTRLTAAILICDMRGFTAMSNRLSAEAVVERLNDYYDCVVPPIRAAGGEILKYVGDGLLAVFAEEPDADAGAAMRLACAQALTATRGALAAVDNSPVAPGETKLRCGVGLHHGTVAYGNIGAGDRLDFTVIGRDVNLASRLEQLSSVLDEPVLMSEIFASVLAEPVRSLGAYGMKGFDAPQPVYGLPAPPAEDGVASA